MNKLKYFFCKFFHKKYRTIKEDLKFFTVIDCKKCDCRYFRFKYGICDIEIKLDILYEKSKYFFEEYMPLFIKKRQMKYEEN